ncbi:MAG TPA: cupin domain-containing protein [Pyrinomonadaceae bacterium]|jgi:mannose-6-phosphate isomerase-like protein (cupin superfamily)
MKIDFAALEWETSASGLRSKTLERDGKRVRLLEHSRAVREEDWCEKPHVGYVVEGELEINFSGKTEAFRAGEGIFIAAGEKHKARSLTEKTLLFLVEEIP